jgi:hypothetical protein
MEGSYPRDRNMEVKRQWNFRNGRVLEAIREIEMSVLWKVSKVFAMASVFSPALALAVIEAYSAAFSVLPSLSRSQPRLRCESLVITHDLAVNVARLLADADFRKRKPESNESRIVQ